jgi:hypothetical protein
MKQILFLVLALSLVFTTNSVSAQQSEGKAKEIELAGEVLSINTAKSQIVIRLIENGKTKNMLFDVTENSVLTDSDQNELGLEEIEQGHKVTVRYSKSRMKTKQRLTSLQVTS